MVIESSYIFDVFLRIRSYAHESHMYRRPPLSPRGIDAKHRQQHDNKRTLKSKGTKPLFLFKIIDRLESTQGTKLQNNDQSSISIQHKSNI